jgi:hypothetical protein
MFVLPPHTELSEPDRAAAAKRLSSILDKSAENLREVSDAEFDAAMNEALQESRSRDD